ncbi:VWA domain-containing protein [bacterium]|nr:VWA domain-containing protein [bacterium]
MKYVFSLILALSCLMSSAQTKKTRILFVLDASNSMYAKMGDDSRIVVAKRLLTRLVDSLEGMENIELALRVYGHQSSRHERNCKDTRLEVGFSATNHKKIKEKLVDVRPKGTTLIAYSLEQAAYDFPEADNVRNVIILITDGLEECEGDPCAVSTALQKQGVIVRPFIIGLGLSEDFKTQFECVGRFFEAETENDFRDVMNVVISQAINNTTVQINLLDKYGRPTETDVNMTIYDAKTGKQLNNFIHTMDYRGNPDTIYLDPSYTYDIKVHTIPPQYKRGVKLVPGTHNTIAIDAPQGNINLIVEGSTKYPDLQALVLDPSTGEILNVQSFNTSVKYIVGEYSLLILTLPRFTQDNVKVDQSTTTKIQVQQPGKLNLITRKKIIAAIYIYKDGKLELIKNIEMSGVQDITVLQPGKYVLIYREAAQKETIKTKERSFEISSGQVTQLDIN